MNITDEQFIGAMELAVQERGGEHVAPGNYMMNGQAYCIVGYALSKIHQSLCPTTNHAMANDLLPSLGCSEKVAWSAFAAQHANDQGWAWAKCMQVFQWGLHNYDRFKGGPAFRLNDFVYEALMQARRDRALEYAKAPALSNGGLIKEPEFVGYGEFKITFHLEHFTTATTALTQAIGSLSATFSNSTLSAFQPVTKKDHDLVA